MLKQIEKQIFVSEDIFTNEYEYVYGSKQDTKVAFAYYNVRKDREGKSIDFANYKAALDFARYRANDNRYKNYEFFIR